MSETKNQKQFYLKIPYEILNLTGIGLCEKVLLAHIYSFGAKGCWQSNKTLAEIFMTSERSIRRWLVAIKAFLLVKNPKGYYRTVWARSHPEVTSPGHAEWDNTDKPYPLPLAKNGRHVGQKRSSESAKNGFRYGQICPSTS